MERRAASGVEGKAIGSLNKGSLDDMNIPKDSGQVQRRPLSSVSHIDGRVCLKQDGQAFHVV